MRDPHLTPATIDEFRFFFQRQVSTVAIITAAHGKHQAGLTATALCSLMDRPPSLIVSVGRRSQTARLIAGSRRFCVNLLHEDQGDIARTFARHAAGDADSAQKFRDAGAWIAGPFDIPLLKDALGSTVCDVYETTSFATHLLVVGSMHDVRFTRDGRPLLYGLRDFCRLSPAAATGSPA